MTAPEDRPDGEAREFLAAADEGMIVEPRTVRFARGWVAATDRANAAEARLEAVKALCDIPDWPPQGVDINGRAMPKHVSTEDILAALSVAPQPQPAACSTCGQPMDTPGCSKNADDPRPRALAGFHTIDGPGPVCAAEPKS